MIKEFKDEFAFLSNFIAAKVVFNSITFNSVENAYQAAKCKFPEDMNEFITITSGQAKRKGKRIVLRDDWESVKLSIMEDLVTQKFNQEPFKTLLINTNDLVIQEGNSWGDTFWGIDLKTGIGQNHLGKILMKIREGFKNG